MQKYFEIEKIFNYKMKQFYAKYTDWEDYKAGMYNHLENDETLIESAIKLLCDPFRFFDVCKIVIKQWPISTRVNLTNLNCNRRAWIGQSACFYECSVPELLTREAWGRLSINQRHDANCIADKIINHFEVTYEKNNFEIHFLMGEAML